MRLRNYLIQEQKLRLKINSPGNYSGELGRIYVNVWQTENKKYWGAEVTIGDYGDDDYEVENFHGGTKSELMGYVNHYIKKHSDAIKRKPKKTKV